MAKTRRDLENFAFMQDYCARLESMERHKKLMRSVTRVTFTASVFLVLLIAIVVFG